MVLLAKKEIESDRRRWFLVRENFRKIPGTNVQEHFLLTLLTVSEPRQLLALFNVVILSIRKFCYISIVFRGIYVAFAKSFKNAVGDFLERVNSWELRVLVGH